MLLQDRKKYYCRCTRWRGRNGPSLVRTPQLIAMSPPGASLEERDFDLRGPEDEQVRGSQERTKDCQNINRRLYDITVFVPSAAI
jgi:hypothetical protein